MAPSPVPTAREALLSLRRDHSALLEDVGKRLRILWIGSGISREQVPPLSVLLRYVLLYLRDSAVVPDVSDPHFKALTRIVDRFLPGDTAALSTEGRTWCPPEDLQRLAESYSEVLSEIVDGKPRDYLLWTAMDVRRAYADPSIEPGPEHELIAILVAERVIESIITTNWDGLIERAIEALTRTGDHSSLAVRMANEDFREATGVCALYKMHGCAVRASKDEDRYRPYLVATTSDIAEWSGNDRYEELRDRIGQLVRNRRSLVLGLSVQDANILSQLATQSKARRWPWDPTHPAYVFAAPALETGHRHVLEVAYGSDYDTNRPTVEWASITRMFSGPLLAALVIHVWTSKLKLAIASAVELVYVEDVRQRLEAGLETFEDAFLEAANQGLSELTAILKTGASGITRRFIEPGVAHSEHIYTPIFPASNLEMVGSSQFRQSGVPRLAVVLGLLGLGDTKGDWRVALTSGSGTDAGELEVRTTVGARCVRIIVVRNEQGADSIMSSSRWVSAEQPTILLRTDGKKKPPLARGFGRGIGSERTERPIHREAWLSEVEAACSSTDSLYSAFRAEVSL